MVGKIIERLIATLGIVALVSYTYGVVARYFARGLVPDWTEEITVYALLWAMMLAGVILVERGRHLTAGILHLVLPNAARYIDRAGLVIAMVFCAAMAWQGVALVQLELRLDEVSRSSLQLPLGYVYAIFPAAMAAMALHYARILLFVPVAPLTKGLAHD